VWATVTVQMVSEYCVPSYVSDNLCIPSIVSGILWYYVICNICDNDAVYDKEKYVI
jgi:hypothetical protein